MWPSPRISVLLIVAVACSYRSAVDNPASYLLCGTPRTGSTFLCGLLSSTGLAGNPESYFREPDLTTWARRLGMPTLGHDPFDYQDFAARVRHVGSTPNGVFAARIMWGSLQHMIAGLAPERLGSTDLDVLFDTFGPLNIVHIRRDNVIAQAVSWARAEQTGYWQAGDSSQTKPVLDLDQVDSLVHTINDHNAAWISWFHEQGAHPYVVTYEELVADPGQTVEGILAHLNLVPLPGWRPSPPHTKQADAVNLDWIRRYLAEREDLPPPYQQPRSRPQTASSLSWRLSGLA